MPELPEIRLSVEQIRPLLIGNYLSKGTPLHSGRYKNTPPEGLEKFSESFRKFTDFGWEVNKCLITEVDYKGKFVYFGFDNGWYLWNTFGMTGQWSLIPSKHACFELKFYNSEGIFNTIYFNDPRHFGTIKFVKGVDKLKEKLATLGWEPFFHHKQENWKQFLIKQLSKSDKPIGQLLLDQSIFCGVGNYIRAEALYLAKISPWKISNKLSELEIISLRDAIISVVEESYKYQGATISTYKTPFGENGKYSSQFKVYKQKKDPNGYSIIREQTPEGRSIFWCPEIQK